VVYPEQVWYGFVTTEDVNEIVQEHLVGGRPVERLALSDSCVNSATCPHKPVPGKRAAVAAGTLGSAEDVALSGVL
jgi:(2Fe-2S) ferredoxin